MSQTLPFFFVLYEKEKSQISQTVQNSGPSVGYVRQRWSRYMCLLVFCWELRGSLTVGNSGAVLIGSGLGTSSSR